MKSAALRHHSRYLGLNCELFVVLFWLVGFVTGVSFGFITPSATVSLMYNALFECVSIVWRISSLCIPFFLTFVSIHSCVFLIIPVVLLKAYSLGFCLYCVCSVFGTAGWLITAICFFVDICNTILLLWFTLFNLQVSPGVVTRRLIYCVIASLLFGLLDYQIISPFVAGMLNY